MSDPVVVTVVADASGFVTGMYNSEAAAQQAAVSIETSLGGVQRSLAEVLEAQRLQATSWIDMSMSARQYEANQRAAAAAAIAAAEAAGVSAAAARKVAEETARVAAARAEEAAATKAVNDVLQQYLGRQAALTEQQAVLDSAISRGVISQEEYAAATNGVAKALHNAERAQAEYVVSSRTAYESGVALSEVASGNFSRLNRTVAALGNSTGILASLFTPLGLAIGGTVGILAGFFALWAKGTLELDEFNRAIIVTGGVVDANAQQLHDLSGAVGQVTGHYVDAKTAMIALVETGKFTITALADATKGSVEFAELTGKSIDEGVKTFEKLAEEPAKYSAKLNESFHYLTPEILAHIQELERIGDKMGANEIATAAFVDALDSRHAQYKTQLGEIATAWGAVKEQIGKSVTESENFLAHASMAQGMQFITAAATGNIRGMAVAMKEVHDAQEQTAKSSDTLAASVAREHQAVSDQVVALQSKLGPSLEKQRAEYDAMNLTVEKSLATKLREREADEIRQASMGKDVQTILILTNAIHQQYAADITAAEGADKRAASNKAAREAATSAKQAQEELNKAIGDWGSGMQAADQLAQELADTMGGPAQQAVHRYNEEIAKLQIGLDDALELYEHSKISLEEYTKRVDAYTLAQQHATDIEQARLVQLQKQYDLIGQATQQYRDLIDELGAYDDVSKARLQTDKEIAKALQDHHDLNGVEYTDLVKLKEAIDSQRPALEQYNIAMLKVKETMANVSKTVQEWQGIFENGMTSATKTVLDFADHTIKTWGDFGKALIGDVKNWIKEILAEFIKLEFINPIINSLFGGMPGGGGLATGVLGNGNMGAGIMSLFGGGGSSTFGGSPSITGSILGNIGSSNLGGLLGEGNTLIGAGNNAWNWLTGGGAAFDATSGMYLLPSSDALGFVPDYSGLGAGAGEFGGEGALASYGGEAGTYGGEAASAAGGGFSYLGAAGGVIAGYNEYNAAGGGLGGLAGGAAYGVGTYLVGTAFTAAMAGGATAGIAALGALGPIGWVALAAMAINMISGGKLFGTAGKPIGGALTETIGAGGASLTEEMTFKGQHALFGGSYYHDKSMPVDPAAQKAADDFYNSLVTGRDAFAKQFNVSMGDIVGGSFVQHFDKKGNPTTTDDTVLGVTYHEDQQHFAERLQADNFVAVLDKMGIGATKFVAGVQSDADKLAAMVQDLATTAQMAQAAIAAGKSLLVGNNSIADVVNEVIKLQGAGEALADTYKRLTAEQAAFKTDMDATAISTGKSAQEVLEFADAAAQAAGGAQALAQLIQQFTQIYYTPDQIAQKSISDLKNTVSTEGAAIGEDPTESLAEFKKHFDAAVAAGISPEDLVKWERFGVDLAQLYSQEVQLDDARHKAATDYASFIASFDSTRTVLSPFEQSMTSLGNSIGVNVDKANALAVAAGKSGASLEDIGKIITSSITEGVKYVLALENEAGQLAAGLFGSSDDQLQQLLDAGKARMDHASATGQYDLFDQQNQPKLQAQLDAQKASEKAAQQLMQATTLLGDLGQIGAITGGSLQDLLAQFHIPMDKFEKMLGLDDAELKNAFSSQVDAAKAALDTAGNTKEMKMLLADINAQLAGKALPYDPNTIIDATTNPSGKNTGHGYTPPPSSGGAQPASKVTSTVLERHAIAQTQLLRDQNMWLQKIAQSRVTERNQRKAQGVPL